LPGRWLTAFGLDSGIEIVTSLVILPQLILQGRPPEAVAILGDEYLADLDAAPCSLPNSDQTQSS
jgi:hypothetical protein